MIVSSGISFHLFSFVPFSYSARPRTKKKMASNKNVKWLVKAFVLRAIGRMNTYDTYMFMDLGWLLKVWSTIDKR